MKQTLEKMKKLGITPKMAALITRGAYFNTEYDEMSLRYRIKESQPLNDDLEFDGTTIPWSMEPDGKLKLGEEVTDLDVADIIAVCYEYGIQFSIPLAVRKNKVAVIPMPLINFKSSGLVDADGNEIDNPQDSMMDSYSVMVIAAGEYDENPYEIRMDGVRGYVDSVIYKKVVESMEKKKFHDSKYSYVVSRGFSFVIINQYDILCVDFSG